MTSHGTSSSYYRRILVRILMFKLDVDNMSASRMIPVCLH